MEKYRYFQDAKAAANKMFETSSDKPLSLIVKPDLTSLSGYDNSPGGKNPAGVPHFDQMKTNRAKGV